MNRSLMAVGLALALAGCSGGGSGINPLHWFGGGRAPRQAETLAPKGGYQTKVDDRLPFPRILSARWEPTVEGRLLVVTAIAPTRGWWRVDLLTQTPQPTGRLRPDADGVLRLRLVGSPPPANSLEARQPARPGPDTVTFAFPVSNAALGLMTEVTVSAADNAISLKV